MTDWTSRLIDVAKRADHKARNRAMFKASNSLSIQDDAVRAVLVAVFSEMSTDPLGFNGDALRMLAEQLSQQPEDGQGQAQDPAAYRSPHGQP